MKATPHIGCEVFPNSLHKAFQKKILVGCKKGKLQVLECNNGDLEDGAAHLVRRLVQSRVALLNIHRTYILTSTIDIRLL